MRDPHVQSLYYRLIIHDNITFVNPFRDVDTDNFAARLDNGILICTIKEHHATADSARAEVDGYLRSWEILSSLQDSASELKFQYERADIIDRDPPPPPPPTPPGSVKVSLAPCIGMGLALPMTIKITQNDYPKPPTSFTLTPDVESLWHRYQIYKEGREPLPAMAYFCLDYIEFMAVGRGKGKGKGRREKAACLFNIEFLVLNTLGRLTSKRGDANSARKRNTDFIPLTGQEINWIESAIRILIIRVGEQVSAPLKPIIMADLPQLTS